MYGGFRGVGGSCCCLFMQLSNIRAVGWRSRVGGGGGGVRLRPLSLPHSHPHTHTYTSSHAPFHSPCLIFEGWGCLNNSSQSSQCPVRHHLSPQECG